MRQCAASPPGAGVVSVPPSSKSTLAVYIFDTSHLQAVPPPAQAHSPAIREKRLPLGKQCGKGVALASAI